MVSAYEEAVMQIKNQMDILDIVSEEVVLKKKGSNYWGLCPFHGEKTPSFSVNPDFEPLPYPKPAYEGILSAIS